MIRKDALQNCIAVFPLTSEIAKALKTTGQMGVMLLLLSHFVKLPFVQQIFFDLKIADGNCGGYVP